MSNMLAIFKKKCFYYMFGPVCAWFVLIVSPLISHSHPTHQHVHVHTHILCLAVYDLVYWRDPKKSGLVFGISLLLLLSLAAFSVISVISYLLLALLCVTISFRVYKSVIQAVQKSGEGHPFKWDKWIWLGVGYAWEVNGLQYLMGFNGGSQIRD